MKALVTGVAGFVGSSIAEKLLNNHHDVIGIDSLTTYYDPKLKIRNLDRLGRSSFTFHKGDLNATDLDELLDGVDVVFHQAGQPGVRKSWGQEFGAYTDANIAATQSLLEATKRSSVAKFVYASSSSVYGEAESYPTHELLMPQPLSPYGVSKLAAEHLCGLYARNFGVPTVSLRYFTVYGPRQRPDMAFTRFIRSSIVSDPIEIYGSGEQIRDFTYIDDVVEANLLAAKIDAKPGSVYNVAGGSSVTVNQVIDHIQQISGRELDVRYVKGVPGDVSRTGGSTVSIQRDLGWSASVSIEEGLRRHYDWGVEHFASGNESSATDPSDFVG